MEFKNNTGQDVYIDVGKLVLVKPAEVINLEGAYSCPPLTPIPPSEPPKKTAKKYKPKSSKSTSPKTI